MTDLMTRADYMQFSSFDYTKEQRMEAHRKYYGQFVNEATISMVLTYIGAEAIKASTNEHMNDIPLRKWDCMHKILPLAIPLRTTGECNSISTMVCIAKEAARIFAARN